jgi:hypothetical protein
VTHEDDKKPGRTAAGGYRESPPDAPPAPPVQPTAYERGVLAEAEIREFEREVRHGHVGAPSSTGQWSLFRFMGCALLAIGLLAVLMYGLVASPCSR